MSKRELEVVGVVHEGEEVALLIASRHLKGFPVDQIKLSVDDALILANSLIEYTRISLKRRAG